MKTLIENLTQLNKLANECQNDNVDIETSLKLYEESIVIAKQCLQQLNDCKGKLVELDKYRDSIDE